MDLKNRFTPLFIVLLLFAAPVLSRGQLKPAELNRLNTEIYEIDYRGPETHSYKPPPDGSSQGNTNAGGGSRRPATEHAGKKVKKLHG